MLLKQQRLHWTAYFLNWFSYNTRLYIDIVRKKLKRGESKFKKEYDELYRITESYIKRLHISEDENDKLRQELEDIKQRSIHSDWETATREQLIDCLKFIGAIRDALDERNIELVLENKELREKYLVKMSKFKGTVG